MTVFRPRLDEKLEGGRRPGLHGDDADQAKAIPIVLAGRDVMGAAQTGTGKTAAFSLPLLHKMLRHENPSMSPARHPVRALVLAPTRELADQVGQQRQAVPQFPTCASRWCSAAST